MRGDARARLLSLPLFALLLVPLLATACDSPPQILEITPGRGAQEVRTNEPIRIHFDRALDRASVASRFTIHPSASGQVAWEVPNTLVFRHETLASSTHYSVSLSGGYRDTRGQVNTFNHSWSFVTERAPEIRVTSPGLGEAQVDPATYLSLTFSREMNARSFQDAVTFSPVISFSVRSDPIDARRVILAPKSLLSASAEYQVSIGSGATDIDGNHLAPTRLRFGTGPFKSLSRWITFVATEAGASSGMGVWMVDEAGFPRLLEEGTVDSFSWTPDGAHLLVRRPDGGWIHFPLGGTGIDLPFKASWAAYLGPESGYAYLDGTELSRLLPNGQIVQVGLGVTGAAVSHDQSKIAFAEESPLGGTDIRAYDVELRAQYRVQHEADNVSGLSWAPSGTRLAYLVSAGTSSNSQLRVKSLAGAAAVTTVASGELTNPAWLADSNDLTFSARVDAAGTRMWRIFRINVSLPPAGITSTGAIGPANGLDAFLPQPSPDGHQIAFLVGTPESAQVWVMNADGTGINRLTGFDPKDFPYTVRGLHWAAP